MRDVLDEQFTSVCKEAAEHNWLLWRPELEEGSEAQREWRQLGIEVLLISHRHHGKHAHALFLVPDAWHVFKELFELDRARKKNAVMAAATAAWRAILHDCQGMASQLKSNHSPQHHALIRRMEERLEQLQDVIDCIDVLGLQLVGSCWGPARSLLDRLTDRQNLKEHGWESGRWLLQEVLLPLQRAMACTPLPVKPVPGDTCGACLVEDLKHRRRRGPDDMELDEELAWGARACMACGSGLCDACRAGTTTSAGGLMLGYGVRRLAACGATRGELQQLVKERVPHGAEPFLCPMCASRELVMSCISALIAPPCPDAMHGVPGPTVGGKASLLRRVVCGEAQGAEEARAAALRMLSIYSCTVCALCSEPVASDARSYCCRGPGGGLSCQANHVACNACVAQTMTEAELKAFFVRGWRHAACMPVTGEGDIAEGEPIELTTAARIDKELRALGWAGSNSEEGQEQASAAHTLLQVRPVFIPYL